eukprot:c8584_g1_i2.p2 GENE.c8584_g1_i2~~c8584_g1_i2.p2  ORF type:complete len:139 (-),score=38.22 c8584_g1_i2:6-422(-)
MCCVCALVFIFFSSESSTVWSPDVRELRDELQTLLNVQLTYAQMNLYRNGDDYIGWHCDSEVRAGDLIASISLGAARRFCLRCKEYKTRPDASKYEFELRNGDLLVMDEGAAKLYWKHCIPKQPNVIATRVNITFRNK